MSFKKRSFLTLRAKQNYLQPIAVYCDWNSKGRYVGVHDSLQVHQSGPRALHGVAGGRHVANEVERGADVAGGQLDVDFYRRRRLQLSAELFNLDGKYNRIDCILSFI